MGQSENGVSGEHEAAGLPGGLTTDVRTLVEMMARNGIADLRLETAGVKLRLRTGAALVATGGTAAGGALAPIAAQAEEDDEPEGAIITAPMLGTFYRAPAPGEPTFVDDGDTIELGQTIGIIEAMKIMNEIAAESAGVVAEFLVKNGQPVEYGQPLLRLAPA